MSSNWFTNLDFSRYNDFFNADELESLYKKVMKRLEEEENKETKNDDVESYSHYDKKVYKDNELVDHVEKEYKNGECIKDIHGHCDKPCIEHKCCENKKSCENELSNTYTLKKFREMDRTCHKQWDEIKRLRMDKELLEEENVNLKREISVLRNKLNKIKNIF